MTTLTQAARDKIKEMAVAEDVEVCTIRVMVVGGGPSGLTYDMDFEDRQMDGDQVVEEGGVTVYIDAMSFQYLQDTTIDYVESPERTGFSFEDNSGKQLGCGSAKPE